MTDERCEDGRELELNAINAQERRKKDVQKGDRERNRAGQAESGQAALPKLMTERCRKGPMWGIVSKVWPVAQGVSSSCRIL